MKLQFTVCYSPGGVYVTILFLETGEEAAAAGGNTCAAFPPRLSGEGILRRRGEGGRGIINAPPSQDKGRTEEGRGEAATSTTPQRVSATRTSLPCQIREPRPSLPLSPLIVA